MNFVERPTDVGPNDRVIDRGLDTQPYALPKWPIHYDSIELLAMATDLVTIVLISVFSGLCYHLLGFETNDLIGKSLGSAILVSAMFVSVMKSRGMYKPTE